MVSLMTDALLPREILVALVGEDTDARDIHEKLLNAETGVTVISAEATLSVTMLTDEQPHVVMVEAGTTDVVSLRAAITTRRVLPEAMVVITELEAHNEDIADYVKAGVEGFVLQAATGQEYIDTVRSVSEGQHVLPDELTSPLFVQIASEGIEIEDEAGGPPMRARITIELTVREKQVVALMREGLANKEIAARMFISLHTVKSHVKNIMEKTGLRTRLLLAVSKS